MPTTLRAALGLFWTCAAALTALGDEAGAPKVLDPRLRLEVVATQPEVVTPTGLTVDRQGNVLVIESHTHFRPANYPGPKADRIRRLEGRGPDGRAARVSTFFEGSTHTMGLAFHPTNGALYVATRSEVFRLFDRDGDGRADGPPEPLVTLETRGDYPHNGLSGVAFDSRGLVYFGLGENLGAGYKLQGRDGSKLPGGGEGGNVFRCAPDGSGLERVATGFWNPFHLAFDAFGRLFAVDNDPDSRPPCRLLHLVPRGDYGYRFRNGRKGLHPFTAWNGELPGTLPMAAGTGEAPSGLVVYESDHFPADYLGTILSTSWGDHRIERFALKPLGASFRGTAEPLVTGGENFRPVGIATAPDGSVYFSDWVDKSYTLHGLGKVWRLAAVQPGARDVPGTEALGLAHSDRPTREAAARKAGRATLRRAIEHDANPRARANALEALLAAGRPEPDDVPALLAALNDPSQDVRALAVREAPTERFRAAEVARDDPSALVRAEALRRLFDPNAQATVFKALGDPDPFTRQAAREALRRSSTIEELLKLAADRARPSGVRLGALLVLRDERGATPRQALPEALRDPDPAVRFVAVRWVGEDRIAEYRPSLVAGLTSSAVTRTLFEAYLAALDRIDHGERTSRDEVAGEDSIAALLSDPKASPAVLPRALRALRPDHPSLTAERFDAFLRSPDPALRLEAVRSLRESPLPGRLDRLEKVAADPAEAANVRAEAVAGLGPDTVARRRRLETLAHDPEPAVLAEATRVLNKSDGRTAPAPAPSRTLDRWLAALEGPADPAAGERLFFAPKGPGCYRCHQVEGRGGRAGPDLTTTGSTLPRPRLVESITDPSREIAPQFVAWLVARKDGTLFTGTLLDDPGTGEQTYADAEGKLIRVKPGEVEDRQPQTVSLMPADLTRLMTDQEFRDLLAYLQASRGVGGSAGPAPPLNTTRSR